MSKVKKTAGVTGERNRNGTTAKRMITGRPAASTKASGRTQHGAQASGKRPGRSAASSRAGSTRGRAAPMKIAVKASPTTKKGSKKKPVAPGVKRKSAKAVRKKETGRTTRGRRPVSDAPIVTVAVKELDPVRKCGPNTTVQFLYRVDESVDGRRTAHLVFFDRHGWYCEHGRTCPAVGHAKKHNGQIARVS